jgi:hypothetical protein
MINPRGIKERRGPMPDIATLAADLQTLAKFLGMVRKGGLPDRFYDDVINDPELRAAFLAAAERRFVAPPAGFKLLVCRWTLEVGDGRSFCRLWREMEEDRSARFCMNSHAYNILNRMPDRLAPGVTSLQCFVVSELDLGLDGGAKAKDVVFARAAVFGLQPFPTPGAVPRLRALYRDQPAGEELTIALRPHSVSISNYCGGILDVFPNPSPVIGSSRQWVFCRPVPPHG